MPSSFASFLIFQAKTRYLAFGNGFVLYVRDKPLGESNGLQVCVMEILGSESGR